MAISNSQAMGLNFGVCAKLVKQQQKSSLNIFFIPNESMLFDIAGKLFYNRNIRVKIIMIKPPQKSSLNIAVTPNGSMDIDIAEKLFL